MPILHMQTENTRQTAKLLTSTGMQCSDVSSQLTSAWSRLRGDWWGESAEIFAYEIEPLLNTLNRLAEQIETLGLRVEREVAEWEQVDADGAASIQGVVIASAGIAGMLGFFKQTEAIVFNLEAKERVKDDVAGPEAYLEDRAAILQDIRENWADASVNERRQMLESLQGQLTEEYGHGPLSIVFDDLEPGTNGYYGESGVYIDEDLLSRNLPGRAINTIVHENRHAMQFHFIENPDSCPPYITGEELRSWEDNIRDYHASSDDFEAYLSQPIERDARAFASQYLR